MLYKLLISMDWTDTEGNNVKTSVERQFNSSDDKQVFADAKKWITDNEQVWQPDCDVRCYFIMSKLNDKNMQWGRMLEELHIDGVTAERTTH